MLVHLKKCVFIFTLPLTMIISKGEITIFIVIHSLPCTCSKSYSGMSKLLAVFCFDITVLT